MPTISCPHCHKTLEAGPTYCPHCFLKLPGVSRVEPAPARPREVGVTRVREAKPRTAREPRVAKAQPAGQCPACSHPITTKDEWCRWCHWPVNRKNS